MEQILLHHALDQQDGDAAGDQRPGDDLRRAQQHLDIIVQRQADDRRGNEGDDQVAQEAPAHGLPPQQPHRHRPEGAPVEHHHRQDRAQLDDDVEHRPGRGVIAQQLARQDQVPGRGYGQELGQSLDDAQQDDGQIMKVHGCALFASHKKSSPIAGRSGKGRDGVRAVPTRIGQDGQARTRPAKRPCLR